MQVALISRKPKGGKLVRGIANEDKLVAMLRDMPNLEPMLVDLASMPLHEQLQLMTHTDLLIGDRVVPELSSNVAHRTMICHSCLDILPQQ